MTLGESRVQSRVVQLNPAESDLREWLLASSVIPPPYAHSRYGKETP